MGKEYSESFERFWSAYPRKVSKSPAFKAWQKHVEGDAFLPTQIIQDIEKRKRLRWFHTDKTKIPHAATWINQRRWEDEEWEDDVKTRGRKHGESSYVSRGMPEDTGPELSGWERMLNRLARNYIMRCGGKLTKQEIKKMIAIKHETLRELENAIEEEIDNAHGDEQKKKARHEAAILLAETMLGRFDIDLQRNIKGQVLT